MTVVAFCLAVAFVEQSSPADTLRLFAHRLPESALVIEVRSRPLAIRDAVTDALRQAVKGSTPRVRNEQLDIARQLGAAYAAAWRDSFLVREVERFAGWPPSSRAGKVWADSVRRAGVDTYGRDGPTSAMAIWRRGLRRATAIADTAGMAALSGNIGAAFLEEGALDSATRYLDRARALAGTVGDIRVEGNATGMLAGVHEERGDVAAGRDLYARALVLRERIDDSRGMAADHNNLGLLAQRLGDLDEAERHFKAALAINRRDRRDEAAATNQLNLAGLAALSGDFTRAVTLYRNALATWRAAERWADAAAALRGLGQLEVRRGDYVAAVAALRDALAILERTGPRADALLVQRELAGALAAQGNLQGALDALRSAQRSTDAGVPARTRAGLLLAQADLAMQLNNSADAERLYARAEFLYRQSGDQAGVADAQEGRGVLLFARGDSARAQALLESAMRVHSAAGNQRSAALARLWLAEVRLQRGDTAAARMHIARAEADLVKVGDPVASAVATGERAALEAGAGFSAVAESLYRAGLQRVAERPAPEVAWQLHAGLALELRARHDLDGAARELRAATREIERSSRSLTLAERRSAFLVDKWDVYVDLALTEAMRGRPQAAFEAAERMRAQEMLELLARGRVVSPSDTTLELIEREQDLRRRIAELTASEHAGDADDLRGGSSASVVAPAALTRAQEAYAELLLEIRELAPNHAALVMPTSAEMRDVAQRLAQHEAFVEYVVSDSSSLVFVITRDSAAVRELGISRSELADLVAFIRGTLVRPTSSAADSLWRGPLRQLHSRLIGPLEETGLLAGKSRLVLAPHAELHYLPFAALLDSAGVFLIERFDLTTTPSASVWLALGRRSPTSSEGVLALAPRPDALPASQREVRAIGRLAGASVLEGTTATESAFRREAPGRRVVHLATFGNLNKGNPLFSHVELGAGDGHDGRLEVHEIYGLELTADLIVLSACETAIGSGAVGDVPAGDDWVGLTRAFLHAGAKRVVATLWQVDDWATAALMEQFYQRYGLRDEPASALAGAQRAILATGATMHPFYWAGFTAVGESDARGAVR